MKTLESNSDQEMGKAMSELNRETAKAAFYLFIGLTIGLGIIFFIAHYVF